MKTNRWISFQSIALASFLAAIATHAIAQVRSPYPRQSNRSIPARWTSTDIGAVGATGNTSGTESSLTLAGSGADIWDVTDAFRFHHVPIGGDQQVIVRVAALEKTDDWAKAGIMFRDSTEPGARHVLLFVTPNNFLGLQWRAKPNDRTELFSAGAATLPAWLKLVRQGNTFTGYRSQDGTNWTLMTPVDVDIQANAQMGFAVTSHAAGKLAGATFDQAKFERIAAQAAPPAPTNLTATPSSEGQINLTWKDNSSNETAFTIERSADNTTFVPIANAGANAGAFTDKPADGATAYHYRVRAIAATTPSPYSNVANAATGPASATWVGRDVGNVGRQGTENLQGTTITVTGSGEDIWENSDAFRFVHRPLRGDGEFIAKVSSLQNTNPWAKAGLMVRESLNPDARNVFVYATNGQGTALQVRNSAGGDTTFAPGSGTTQPPVWLKLARNGNTLTAFSSADGQQWTQIGSANLALGNEPLIGFGVTAHDPSNVSTATFSEIKAP